MEPHSRNALNQRFNDQRGVFLGLQFFSNARDAFLEFPATPGRANGVRLDEERFKFLIEETDVAQ
jgi:hypothetical protein